MSNYVIGIIDDDVDGTKDYKDIYEDKGFETHIFDIDEDSIYHDVGNWIIENKIELIMVDYLLSNASAKFNGDKILNYVKQNFYQLPVIILTSRVKEAEKSNYIEHWFIQSKDELDKKENNYMVSEIKHAIDVFRFKKEKWMEEYKKLFEKKEKNNPDETERLKELYRYLRTYGEVDDISTEYLNSDLSQKISEFNDIMKKLLK